MKLSSQAEAALQRILNRRGRDLLSPLYPLAQLGLALSALLGGDRATVSKAYQELFQLWKDADADLEPRRSARQEYQPSSHHWFAMLSAPLGRVDEADQDLSEGSPNATSGRGLPSQLGAPPVCRDELSRPPAA